MTGPCRRPGCAGSYDPDGYCDECGRKAPALVGAGVSSSSAGPSPSTGSAASTGSGASTGSSRSSRSSRRTGRGRLGGGLLDLPRVPLPDPATAVLADPKVAQDRRFCGNPECERPVGRDRDGRPGRDVGFCPACRTPFSFVPSLAAGTLVGGRYEVLGCLAYGGLGWIYLARDKNIGDDVSDRWVVLKGLIDAGDPDAMAAAVSERRFLVTVDHPGIVKIHDFVLHPDPRSGDDVGYIVMAYVGGRSLRDLRTDRSAPGGAQPLALEQVIAYGLEILPAFGYLHERGLLYCDFKPDNAIHADDRLVLVDLGAVRRIDDTVSPVWGTVGYQAPEVARAGPSVSSDLYTVGRTMAVLSLDFRGFSSTYVDRLPPASEHPLLTEHESYHRFLLRAADRDPDRRFETAADMSDQLLGVLRQVLAAADGKPRPAPSTQFTGEGTAFATDFGAVFDGPGIAAALPVPQVDPADPGASFLLATRDLDPHDLAAAAASAPADSVEVPIALARARIAAGDTDGARQTLDALAADLPLDWRIDWYRGLAALTDRDPRAAGSAFDAVYGTLPGELVPQLALAVAAEWAGDPDDAYPRYRRVWTTDHGYVSAAFGLARILLSRGRHDDAAQILGEVPASSSHRVAAEVAAARARLAAPPAAAVFADVSARIEQLPLDVGPKGALSVELLTAALAWVRNGADADRGPSTRVLGHPLTERGLRFGLEQVYRTLARVAPDAERRIALVDQANRIRPRTLV